jgi:hypothetical protein
MIPFIMTPYQQLVAWKGALLLTTKRREREDDVPFDWDSVPVGTTLPLPGGVSGNPFEVARVLRTVYTRLFQLFGEAIGKFH